MRDRTPTRQMLAATAGTHYRIEPWHNRAFALYDDADNLIGVFIYLKGAAYVARRLTELEARSNSAQPA